ncbi:MAG: penicillin-binding protein 2 [Pedosphaera sp.]|nr:penicillin-binding protein 2 [Pedosphaera sp.]
MKQTSSSFWLRTFTWLTAACLGGAAGRLAWVQVVQPLQPVERADITDRVIVRHGRRGMIRDGQGTPLALSETIYNLKADPQILSNDAPRFADAIAPWLGLPAVELRTLLDLSNHIRWVPRLMTNAAGRLETHRVAWTNRSVLVKSGVLPQDWELIRSNLHELWRGEQTNEIRRLTSDLPRRKRTQAIRSYRERMNQLRVLGLTAESVELRSYPHESLAAHVVGYVTNALDARQHPLHQLRGVMGIERQFNEQLRGRDGQLLTHVTRAGELAAERELDLKALDGMDVVLTLDLRIQSIAEQAVATGFARLSPKSITAIVVRPQNGEILGLVCRPGFVPGRMGADSQTVNYATRMQIEPGSTFKIFTYAAVLNEGLALHDNTEDTENGHWARYKVNDDHRKPGRFSLEDSFAHSFNTVAAKLTMRLPEDVLVRYMTNFGFGTPSGIPLGYEDRGRVKFPATRGQRNGWDGFTQSRMAYGYSITATPIQMAMAVAMIANGGTLYEPQLVKRIEGPGGTVLREFYSRKRASDLLKPETIQTMHRFMRRVVTHGTGGKAAVEDWAVAGKTGTAKKIPPGETAYSNRKFYGSFFGFLPVEDPQLAICVIVDEPILADKAYYGGAAAGPIFADIARGAAAYLAIRPSPKADTVNFSGTGNVPPTGKPIVAVRLHP